MERVDLARERAGTRLFALGLAAEGVGGVLGLQQERFAVGEAGGAGLEFGVAVVEFLAVAAEVAPFSGVGFEEFVAEAGAFGLARLAEVGAEAVEFRLRRRAGCLEVSTGRRCVGAGLFEGSGRSGAGRTGAEKPAEG